jgi:hypothetical protein
VPRQQTIRINQGYRIDSKWEALALTGRALRRLVRLLWRWRTELGSVTLLLAVRLVAGHYLTATAAYLVVVSVVILAAAWPWSRTLAGGRLRCARTRRRLHACMRETRVATTSGRLPLVLRSRITQAGERLTFGLYPGQSAELLDARVEELRAAARARDVTVTRDPTRADRVTVDVIRRDPLAGPALPSPLLGYAAGLHAAAGAAPARPVAALAGPPAAAEEVV